MSPKMSSASRSEMGQIALGACAVTLRNAANTPFVSVASPRCSLISVSVRNVLKAMMGGDGAVKLKAPSTRAAPSVPNPLISRSLFSEPLACFEYGMEVIALD